MKNILIFLLFGGSRVGHGRGRDRWRQPRRKELYPPLQLSRASQIQSPSITSHCVAGNACCGYRQRVGLASAGRGWESRVGATGATKNSTLSSSTWYRIEQPGPIQRGGVGYLTSQVRPVVVEEAALSSEWAAGPSMGEFGGRKIQGGN